MNTKTIQELATMDTRMIKIENHILDQHITERSGFIEAAKASINKMEQANRIILALYERVQKEIGDDELLFDCEIIFKLNDEHGLYLIKGMLSSKNNDSIDHVKARAKALRDTYLIKPLGYKQNLWERFISWLNSDRNDEAKTKSPVEVKEIKLNDAKVTS